jgi:uncharacterized membrane protein
MQNKSNNTQLREKKKSIVLNQNQRKTNKTRSTAAILSVLIIVCGAVLAAKLFWFKDNTSGREVVSNTSDQIITTDHISHPLRLFDDGQARHFSFPMQGLTIRYFIIKSADGVLRAAFDACDVCWKANKGYYQEGDNMVCGNCGRRFASNLVNEVQGGCNPAPLPRLVKNDRLIIKKDDMLKGRVYFDL